MEPKELVRRGYDRVSYAYRSDEPEDAWAQYEGLLADVTTALPRGSRVLDLGCGCGVPGTRILAERFRVVGVDFSEVQIARARRLVPEAEFVLADISQLDLPAGSFDVVVALYALIHVPLAEQPAILRNVARWLRPRGYLLATVGSAAWTGTEDDWLGAGAPMYWSHADEQTYLRWLAEVGLGLTRRRFIPEGEGGHVLLFAEKSGAAVAHDA